MYVPNDRFIYYITFQKLLDDEEQFPSDTYLIIDESHIFCKEKVRSFGIIADDIDAPNFYLRSPLSIFKKALFTVLFSATYGGENSISHLETHHNFKFLTKDVKVSDPYEKLADCLKITEFPKN